MYGITDLKTGTTFELEGQPFVVLSYEHSKQGRSGAVLRTKIKNLINGAILQRTFQGSEKFNEVQIERKSVQFLYQDAGRYFFMDQGDYSQFDMGKDDLNQTVNFLKDGEIVQAQYYEGRAINIELPVKMDFEVTEASEGLKGNSASTSTKTIVIETGYKLNVPLFIKKGDKIRVNTQTGEYVERAN